MIPTSSPPDVYPDDYDPWCLRPLGWLILALSYLCVPIVKVIRWRDPS